MYVDTCHTCQCRNVGEPPLLSARSNFSFFIRVATGTLPACAQSLLNLQIPSRVIRLGDFSPTYWGIVYMGQVF
jgi:hypothetical protein